MQDFDIYEIHEAFAAQVLCTLKAWESGGILPREAGPQGAAGLARSRQAQPQGQQRGGRAPRSPPPARASSALWPKELAVRGSGRGLISICTAGGMGVNRDPRTLGPPFPLSLATNSPTSSATGASHARGRAKAPMMVR
ncbi:MAG: hypothetical protein WDN04_26740 [Rhodospirillales bacterium]